MLRFSEIPAFLSEAECTRLLYFAEHGKLENSDVFHYSTEELLSQTSFEQWDLNRDDVINPDEVFSITQCRNTFLYEYISASYSY